MNYAPGDLLLAHKIDGFKTKLMIIPLLLLIFMIGFSSALIHSIYICALDQNVILEYCDNSYSIWMLRVVFLISILNSLAVFIYQLRELEFNPINSKKDSFIPLKSYTTDFVYSLMILTLIEICLIASIFVIINVIEVLAITISLININRSVPKNIWVFKTFLLTFIIGQAVLFLYDSLRAIFNISNFIENITDITNNNLLPIVDKRIIAIKVVLLGIMILFRYTLSSNFAKKKYYPYRDIFPSWAPILINSLT